MQPCSHVSNSMHFFEHLNVSHLKSQELLQFDKILPKGHANNLFKIIYFFLILAVS